MKLYNKSIHTKAQLIKSILGCIEQPFFNIHGYLNKHDLIVLNYHSTPLKFIANFEEQINFYKAHFSIVSPNDLKNFYANKLESKKPKLLITFDDGLSNNKYALQVLDKYDIKALLFIVPDFIESTKQKDYYTNHIRSEIKPLIDMCKSKSCMRFYVQFDRVLKSYPNFISGDENTFNSCII
jgi:hypothetical protein